MSATAANPAAAADGNWRPVVSVPGSNATHPNLPTPEPGTRTFSITVILTVSVVLLVAVAVGLLTLAGYRVARQNTLELVQDKAVPITDSVITRVRDYLDPARAELEFLGQLIVTDQVPLSDRATLGTALRASLAGVPQVSVVAYVHPDRQVLRALRNRTGTPVVSSDWSDDPVLRRTMKSESLASSGGYWASLFVAENVGRTYVNVQLPVRRGKEFLASLVAGVAIDPISDLLSSLGGDYTYNPFILYDKEYVLAHPLLQAGFSGLNDHRPLPRLVEIGDPILSEIWSENRDHATEISFSGNVEVRAVNYLGKTYVFMFRYLTGYGEKPWIVGTYLHLQDAAKQLDRLRLIPQIGLGVLAVALIAALLLGRGLAQPVRRLAAVADHIRQLDIDGAPRLRPGLFRELNLASTAMNAMVEGLKSFETYVPRALVRRLMEQGSAREIASIERDITVLFTDIVGFTALAEHRPAAEVAGLLNDHFTLLSECVESEQGTVDKYVGDTMMAFWGARDNQPDHAFRACRAAGKIAAAIRADNVGRRKAGHPALHIRIGIHSGSAIVGNIGAPTRVNYTVIGDTVNLAERLEALCRTVVEDDAEVGALVSSVTAGMIDGAAGAHPVGRYNLPGRDEPIDVFRLHLD